MRWPCFYIPHSMDCFPAVGDPKQGWPHQNPTPPLTPSTIDLYDKCLLPTAYWITSLRSVIQSGGWPHQNPPLPARRSRFFYLLRPASKHAAFANKKSNAFALDFHGRDDWL
jgi:hypothetical protein